MKASLARLQAQPREEERAGAGQGGQPPRAAPLPHRGHGPLRDDRVTPPPP
jgi:hypothetical protein